MQNVNYGVLQEKWQCHVVNTVLFLPPCQCAFCGPTFQTPQQKKVLYFSLQN